MLVSEVSFDWPQLYLEVSLFYVVLEPIESNIYLFGCFFLIIKLDWSWGVVGGSDQ